MVSKRKTVKKTNKSHKKNKQHPKHFLKVYWPYIPVLAVVTFGMLFGGVNPNTRKNQPATLAYATEMSRSGLLSGTNTQRVNNGFGTLTINSKLNSAAQAKANDMVAKDYWSHNTPSGDPPWIFFDAAGYSYQKAGENLAYGFENSNETIVGWMNSATHRANLLDPLFTEVGFGFANSGDYVTTGNQTIVVAFYAKPAGATPAPTPPSTSKALPATVKQEEPAPEPAPEPEPAPADKADQPFTTDTPAGVEPESKNITLLQSLTNGDAPWSALVLSGVAFTVVIIWLIKHAVLVKRFLLEGEHFVAHHPLLDLIVVTVAAVSIYLSRVTGVLL